MSEENPNQNNSPQSNESGMRILERMSGINPEIKDMVDDLIGLGLGRPIARRITQEVIAKELNEGQVIAKTLARTEGLEYTPKNVKESLEYLGIILPCDPNNNEHLVILVDGSIFIIQPNEESEYFKDLYKKFTSPGEFPLKVLSENTLPKLRHELLSRNSFPHIENNIYFQLIASSDNPQQKDLITSKIKDALQLAVQIKEEKERARQEVADQTIKLFREFFRSSEPEKGE